MTRPDFIIVGAPKCGTTSLAQYFGQHPEILMSRIKEPFFFASDLSGGSHWSETQYRRMFDRAGTRRSGEATTWYLFSSTAAREIHDWNPQARIIIMLRDPAAMLPSLHQQLVYNQDEDLDDFSAALAAEDRRREGRDVPRRCHSPYALRYTDVARFSGQVQRYLDVFPREQVRVILFDDFTTRTSEEVAETFRFLDVDPAFQPQLGVHNPAKETRSRLVRRLVRNRAVQRVARVVTPASTRAGIADFVDRLNRRRTARAPIDAACRARLRELLAEDVARLGAIVGRDLGHWLREDW